MNAIPVHARNPGPMTGEGNWTWLLPGRVPTLVDAGTGEPGHLDAVEQALAGDRLAQVLVTHAHGDHVSGAVAIARRFEGVRFLKMSWEERDSRWPVDWESLADGQAVAAGDETLSAVHTPGHAPDHLCFWHDASRTMFSGDLAVKGSTIYIPANLGGDLVQYLASLERVLALAPARLCPAHGPIIEDPKSVLRGYITHRRRREAQIMAALAEADRTPDALVPIVYPGLKEHLAGVVRETILAHLLKLEREGRAGRRGEAWHMIGP